MTAIEVIQDEARKRGREITAEQADYIAWEHTGFPYFWRILRDGATPEECLRKQVGVFLDSLPDRTP